jgi:glycosyltransferase involved in cell wall biosynthesis
MFNGKKIIAVLPAYNAEKTLKLTLDDLPMDIVDDIILVDDASRDGTAKLSRELGLKTFVHEKNTGYGGNQKTCYREALKLGADIVVMVHPDHQYDPKAVARIVVPFTDGECEAVFGSRMIERENALKGGMPYWKFLANIFLTDLENFFLGLDLTEYHSGFRAYSAKLLRSLPLERNSDNFVFDTEIIVQTANKGYKIKEIPIPTKYFKDASSIGLMPSINYGLSILRVLARYKAHKWGIKKNPQFE